LKNNIITYLLDHTIGTQKLFRFYDENIYIPQETGIETILLKLLILKVDKTDMELQNI